MSAANGAPLNATITARILIDQYVVVVVVVVVVVLTFTHRYNAVCGHRLHSLWSGRLPQEENK